MGNKRASVQHIQEIVWDELPKERQERLLKDLHSIVQESYDVRSLDVVREMVEGNEVLLLHGARGELVGFSAVALHELTIAGKRCAVFKAGLVIRLGYRGGATASRYGLRKALIYKLRHPRVRVGFISPVISPAMYKRMDVSAPRLYPRRGTTTPAHVHDMFRAMVARRGWELEREEPWIIRTGITHRDASWASKAMSLRGDAGVAFFESIAPAWPEGQAALVWMPLDLTDILRAMLRLATG